MHLCLFEDGQADNFLPLTWFRPVYDLRCGVFTMRERIVRLLRPSRLTLHARISLRPLLAEEHASAEIGVISSRDCLLVNGRCLMSRAVVRAIGRLRPNTGLSSTGVVLAVRLVGAELDRVRQGLADEYLDVRALVSVPMEELSERLVAYPWDLIGLNREMLESDFAQLAGRGGSARAIRPGPLVGILGRMHVRIGKGSVLDPGVVLDARGGPVIIGDNVHAHPGAVVEGPAFVGDGSVLKIGAKIYGPTSIGPVCRVGGEVDSTILHSYANKQHDGFLGHSYLSPWVNLGAGTTTSNLKNTYGTIRAYCRGGLVDTGEQFLGLLAGDHSKTGINVSLDTGTVIGPSSNLFGAGLPPKFIPSFSWGGPATLTQYERAKALAVAVRVMARRGVVASETYAQLFSTVFDLSAHERTGR